MKQFNNTVVFSAPGKIHLLGEHSVVYGKPALLATVDLKVTVTISNVKDVIPAKAGIQLENSVEWIPAIEPIIKKHLKIKTLPPYQLNISSQLPIGSGLGSSAAISASYIAALLTFLKAKWDLNLVNNLTFEAEKIWHGNPSGADNSAVIFGGLVWFRKETEDVKLIHQLPFSIPHKLSRNFVLINTGKPKESTKEMVEEVNSKFLARNALARYASRIEASGSRSEAGRQVPSSKFRKLLDKQEQLTRELLSTIQQANEKELIRIIKEGEKNLESIGVVSKQVMSIIRSIETQGGAAKICGGGGKSGPTGILLCYHPTSSVIEKVAKQNNLDYFKTALGVEGLRRN